MEELVDAYKHWTERYLDLAGGALAAFIDKYAPSTGEDAEAKTTLIEADTWQCKITLKIKDGSIRSYVIDGRIDFELFRRCRAALQRIAPGR